MVTLRSTTQSEKRSRPARSSRVRRRSVGGDQCPATPTSDEQSRCGGAGGDAGGEADASGRAESPVRCCQVLLKDCSPAPARDTCRSARLASTPVQCVVDSSNSSDGSAAPLGRRTATPPVQQLPVLAKRQRSGLGRSLRSKSPATADGSEASMDEFVTSTAPRAKRRLPAAVNGLSERRVLRPRVAPPPKGIARPHRSTTNTPSKGRAAAEHDPDYKCSPASNESSESSILSVDSATDSDDDGRSKLRKRPSGRTGDGKSHASRLQSLAASLRRLEQRLCSSPCGSGGKARHPRASRVPKLVTRPATVRQALLGTASQLDVLPCREDEFFHLVHFVTSRLTEGTGGCMYVSGVPGSGKTATVTAVIRHLRQLVATDCLPDFKLIDVNGMKVAEPRLLYSDVAKELFGVTVPPKEAINLLTTRFYDSRSPIFDKPVLIVVDELDMLYTKRQEIIYNIFEWPDRPAGQQVTVVAIANTMDLPERAMMARVASRLSLTRLPFEPYTHQQLADVIRARLGHFEQLFEADAIQLAARKVAAISGDVRRAFEICTRAAEIAECDNPGMAFTSRCPNRPSKNEPKFVTVMHVNKAITELFSSIQIQSMQGALSDMELAVLRAVVAEMERTGLEEVSFGQVYSQLSTILSLLQLPPCAFAQLCMLVHRLGNSRLLVAEEGCYDMYARVRLNVSTTDVMYAVKAREKSHAISANT